MSKTIELRKNVVAILKEIHPNIYYMKASDDSAFPYIVYSIRDVANSKVLELDYWDKNTTTTPIEILADNVEQGVKNTFSINASHSITFYYNNDRQFFEDEDEFIKRINHSFEIRYYGLEE